MSEDIGAVRCEGVFAPRIMFRAPENGRELFTDAASDSDPQM